MKELDNLIPDTAQVLQKLAKLPLLNEFSFVGGSALSIYLAHRFSEDIDLFTWHKRLDSVTLQEQLEIAGGSEVRIVNLSPTQADFVMDNVKVTFFANGWDELKNRNQLIDNLYIAELATIAVMKVNTLFLRAKYRDYYDLYVLNIKHYSLEQLYEMTSVKMKNLNKTLFQKALIFTEDIDDESIKHLKPYYNVTLKQIENHFIKQIKLWNNKLK